MLQFLNVHKSLPFWSLFRTEILILLYSTGVRTKGERVRKVLPRRSTHGRGSAVYSTGPSPARRAVGAKRPMGGQAREPQKGAGLLCPSGWGAWGPAAAPGLGLARALDAVAAPRTRRPRPGLGACAHPVTLERSCACAKGLAGARL